MTASAVPVTSAAPTAAAAVPVAAATAVPVVPTAATAVATVATALAAPAPSQASAPTALGQLDLGDFLDSCGLAKYFQKLVGLGAKVPADLHDCTDADFFQCGMTKIDINRLKQALSVGSQLPAFDMER
eukprot:SAG31_NODE_7522_length_1666_cov_1.345246_2_plen_129_part_00